MQCNSNQLSECPVLSSAKMEIEPDMHSISARKPEGFKVEVFDWSGKVAYSAWHQDRDDAQTTAEHWERLVTLGLADGEPHPTLDEILNDDELLKQLNV